MWKFFHQFTSPRFFYRFAGQLIPWIWAIFALLLMYGLVAGLVFAPPDYQQGEAYRIIYIHVPAASLSLTVFSVMGVMSIIYLIWRVKLADVIATASVSIGAWFTFLALVTGAIWGKPMWGTWWIWDARLTSELILLFLYMGIIALRNAIKTPETAAKAASILTIIGLIDLPIIHYSVDWWNTLHQKATILKFAKPDIVPSMLWPLLAMMGAFFLYYLALMLMRTRNELLVREKRAEWVKRLFVN
jgi:heme exporter protein C